MGTLTTTPVKTAGRYELQPGFSVPRRMRAKFEGFGDVPYDVELVVGVDGGQMVCESVTCHRKPGGPAVTSEGIRGVPVATLLHKAAWREAEADYDRSPGAADAVWRIGGGGMEQLRHQGPTGETLDVVAFVYRWAHLLGRPPTKDVMEAFGVPRATAGRWVSMARRQGFLGAARDRRPGEEV